MKPLIRWGAIVVCIFALASFAFNAYGSFLLDYSLDNLENALMITNHNQEDTNPLEQSIYKKFVQDLALDEAIQENSDMRGVVFLDIASRSIGETVEREGNQRAELYLEQVKKTREQERFFLLRFFDKAYYMTRDLIKVVYRFVDYVYGRLVGQGTDEVVEEEYSSVFILTQAGNKESEGVLDEAAELYRKFLEFYPDNKQRGLVSVSLANIYMRQGDYDQSKTILKRVRREFLGSQEAELAASMLDRIVILKERQDLITNLKRSLKSKKITPESEATLFRLAVAELSVYQFEEAEKHFEQLLNSDQEKIQQKAGFYLGWLYKMKGNLDKSEAIFADLVENEQLDRDLSFGLHTQLADVYYQQKDPEKALNHLEIVSGGTKDVLDKMDVTQKIWASIAEIEKANIYYFDAQNFNGVENSLSRLRNLPFGAEQVSLYDLSRNSNENLSLRDKAFRALSRGEVYVAYDLLQKNLTVFPRDPWTHSALATLFLLFGENEKAKDYALKGYNWFSDEYTISVLAYVYSYMENYEEALKLYESAVAKDPEYIPAKFNLACMYLELDRYNEAVEVLVELESQLELKDNYMKSKALNNLGYALWWLGAHDEAVEYFERALARTPGFKLAKRNLQLIKREDTPEMVTFKG